MLLIYSCVRGIFCNPAVYSETVRFPELTAFRSGSWAIITAENTSTHPTNSLTESLSPKMTHPASTANTDSRLINNDSPDAIILNIYDGMDTRSVEIFYNPDG